MQADGWTVAHWAAQRGYEEMLSFIADRYFGGSPASFQTHDFSRIAPFRPRSMNIPMLQYIRVMRWAYLL